MPPNKFRPMKKNFILALLAMLVAVASCSFTNKSFENDDKDKLLMELIAYVLERGHYEPKEINDNFSSQVFDGFIENLDPTKRYFLESDIRDFEKYRFTIDDELKNTDISFFNLVYQRLMLRMGEAKEIYREVLAKPFDYTLEENISIDYEEQKFASNTKQLEERWRKQLKYNTLTVFEDKVGNRIADAAGDAQAEGGKIVPFREIPKSVDKQ